MKTSRGISVAGLSAALVATGWAIGTGFLTPAKALPAAAESSADAASTPPSSAQTDTAATVTYDGSSVDTRYGAFQAQITVEDGQVTDVVMLQDGETDRKSEQINARAFPQLIERVLEAQSADVQAVSGASYTSYGVLTSIESALQEAGLA
jgi:uncharacterized protein with FMN-binding domain